MSTPSTPVRMSGDNPTGWKLEELVQQLRLELHAKNDRIALDPSPAAKTVRVNNLGIIDLLSVIEGRQRDTLALLDSIRPDPSPGGPPRIGMPASASDPARADPVTAEPAPAPPAL